MPLLAMKPETLKALKKSIAHWKRMATDPKCKESPYNHHCALCERFSDRISDLGSRTCSRKGIGATEDCPVKIRAGQPYCSNTPWLDASLLHRARELHWNQWQTAARKEIAFLESLLPVKTSRKAPKRLHNP